MSGPAAAPRGAGGAYVFYWASLATFQSIAVQRAVVWALRAHSCQRFGLIIVPPAVTVVPATPITAAIIVTAAIHIRIPIIRPAPVVDSHVSCSLRSGGRDRTLTGEKKHSEQYQLQQTVPRVKPLPRRIGTAYPATRFTVTHLHILDKGPSHVQKQSTQGVAINWRMPLKRRCYSGPSVYCLQLSQQVIKLRKFLPS